MSVNKLIQVSDFNNIRQKVIDVLGTGSASYGYGQPIRSSVVSEGSLITVTSWNNLAYDVINAYVHQVGSAPLVPSITENTIIETSATGTTFKASISDTTMTVKLVSVGMISPGQTISTGALAGTTIISKIENIPVTITSMSGIVTETVTADYYSDAMYKVTYIIPLQVEAPLINQWYTVEGNSNNRFNGTVRCVASTTTSISLVYNSDPENTKTATVALELSLLTEPVYAVDGTISPSGPNRTYAGKNIVYVTETNYSAALVSGLTIGSGISGTGIPANTSITGSERLLINDLPYYAISMSNSFITTSTTATINVGSNGTKLKLSSTLGIEPGMSISGTGYSSQTVVSVSSDDRTITTSAPPSTTPSGTVTFKNQYGTGITVFRAGTTDKTADGNPWGESTWQVSQSQTIAYTTMTASSGADIFPYSYYDPLATTLQTNRFDIASGQFITTNKGSYSQALSAWNTRAYTTISMSFTTSEKARAFFNSGGKITLTSSLSGGTSSEQYDKWVSLLTSISATWGGISYFSLTSTPTQIYISAASTPYTGNYIKISASTPGVTSNSSGTASTINFLVELIDGYVDKGPPAPGDLVDGTLAFYAVTTEAYGFLVPAGAGNFTVESPTINFGNIFTDGNLPTYVITTPSTSITEGQSAPFNLYTNAFINGTLYVRHIGTYLNGTTAAVPITSNVGVYTVNALPETGDQGSRTIQLEMRTDSASGTIVATSTVVALSG